MFMEIGSRAALLRLEQAFELPGDSMNRFFYSVVMEFH